GQGGGRRSRPWRGEKGAIAISRPAGTGGQTLTVDDAQLALAPGIRSTSATLTVKLRSSRGGEHAFALPAGATLESVRINGTVEPLRQDGAAGTGPVAPRTRALQLTRRGPLRPGARVPAPGGGPRGPALHTPPP